MYQEASWKTRKHVQGKHSPEESMGHKDDQKINFKNYETGKKWKQLCQSSWDSGKQF